MLNGYWLSSGYGEEPVRAILNTFILSLIAFFSLSIIGIEPYGGGAEFCSNSLENAWTIFVSTLQLVTFNITREYKPATNLGTFIVIVFKILIPVQAALFVFALRNRFRR